MFNSKHLTFAFCHLTCGHDFDIPCLEISKVRGSLFQLSKVDDPRVLPQPVGPSVTLSEKLAVPVNEYPDVRICD